MANNDHDGGGYQGSWRDPKVPPADEERLPKGLQLRDLRKRCNCPEWKLHTLFVVDRIMEPQTIPRFLESISFGKLPGSTESNLTKFPLDDVLTELTTPYNTWAKAPYDKIDKAPIDQLMIRIGSHEDSDRLQIIAKQIQALKTRIWEGVPPVSPRRWELKKLNEPENFNMACQQISSIVEAFHYLNDPTTADRLRTTYNLIYDHLADFQTAINAIRTREGKDPLNITSLWAAYIRARYDYMTCIAHTWGIDRANELTRNVIRRLREHQPPSLSHDFNNSGYTPTQWDLTNKLRDLGELGLHVDAACLMSTQGYKGLGHAPHLGTHDERVKIMGAELKKLRRVRMIRDLEARGGQLDPRALNDPEVLAEAGESQIEAQAEARGLYHVANEGKEELTQQWIIFTQTQLDQPEYPMENFGFVVYRLTYNQSPPDWQRFVQTVEADVADWGQGIKGAAELKPKALLHWLDGQSLGIPEGDIEAAKRHFQTYQTSPEFPPGLSTPVFLAIDSHAYTSYTHPLPSAAQRPHGDFGGFLLAVEAEYDPQNPGDHAEESPGFPGYVRVLGNLVYSDLYALMAPTAAYPEDLWPLAMQHPLQVYVGPPVEGQMKEWDEVSEARGEVLRGLEEWIRGSGRGRGSAGD